MTSIAGPIPVKFSCLFTTHVLKFISPKGFGNLLNHLLVSSLLLKAFLDFAAKVIYV